MIDSVDGMISAPPMPIATRTAIIWAGSAAERRGQRRRAEQHQPDDHDLPAAEPVAQAARGEQQPGEHQDVGVEDPLGVLRARAQVLGHLGHRDGQRHAVHHQDQRAQAEHDEDPPAAWIAGQQFGEVAWLRTLFCHSAHCTHQRTVCARPNAVRWTRTVCAGRRWPADAEVGYGYEDQPRSVGMGSARASPISPPSAGPGSSARRSSCWTPRASTRSACASSARG